MKPTLTITFDNEKLRDEFIGWLSDGGGEDSFNLVEHVGDFKFNSGSETMEVVLPNV